MTCIVAVEHDGKVYMGGDSAAVTGEHIVAMTEPKVFHRGPFLIGFTGSLRMGQLLQHTLRTPAQPAPTCDVHEYLVTKFIPSVRNCLSAGGWLKNNQDRAKAGQFMVGYRGRLYVVDDDLQIGRPADGYYAIGSGAEYALGSLYTTGRDPVGFSVSRRIFLALEAAEHHSTGVCAPYTIEETK